MESYLASTLKKPTAADTFQAILTILVSIPIAISTCLFRRLLHTTTVPLRQDLILCIIRRTSNLGPLRIPLAYSRSSTFPTLPLPAVSSKRFSNFRNNLVRRVQRNDFAGYWISLSSSPPEEGDVVIFFIHGGGYNIGHPLQNLTSILRLTEILASRPGNGTRVSTFSLNYSLAPEAVFPAQQNQALAAYEYLIHDQGISPDKIILYGESAGGHLAISLLLLIQEQGFPKPGAAYLLAPDVDLTNSGESFNFNRSRDGLTKKDLDRCVENVLGGEKGRKEFSHLLDFSSDQHQNWERVLPGSTYVNVGDHEVFLSSILEFSEKAKAQGAAIEVEIMSGKPHAWQGYLDIRASQKYLGLSPEEGIGELMLGAKNISTGMIKLIDGLRNLEHLQNQW